MYFRPIATRTPGRYSPYYDPNIITDDYGNIIDLWEIVWNDPTPNCVAAAYYFKHSHTNLWDC